MTLCSDTISYLHLHTVRCSHPDHEFAICEMITLSAMRFWCVLSPLIVATWLESYLFSLFFTHMSSSPKAYYVNVECDGIQPRVSSKYFYEFFERFVTLPCKVVQVSHESIFEALSTLLLVTDLPNRQQYDRHWLRRDWSLCGSQHVGTRCTPLSLLNRTINLLLDLSSNSALSSTLWDKYITRTGSTIC